MFVVHGAFGPGGRVRGDRVSFLLESGFMALIVAFLPVYVTLGHRRRLFAATERTVRLRSRWPSRPWRSGSVAHPSTFSSRN